MPIVVNHDPAGLGSRLGEDTGEAIAALGTHLQDRKRQKVAEALAQSEQRIRQQEIDLQNQRFEAEQQRAAEALDIQRGRLDLDVQRESRITEGQDFDQGLRQQKFDFESIQREKQIQGLTRRAEDAGLPLDQIADLIAIGPEALEQGLEKMETDRAFEMEKGGVGAMLERLVGAGSFGGPGGGAGAPADGGPAAPATPSGPLAALADSFGKQIAEAQTPAQLGRIRETLRRREEKFFEGQAELQRRRVQSETVLGPLVQGFSPAYQGKAASLIASFTEGEGSLSATMKTLAEYQEEQDNPLVGMARELGVPVDVLGKAVASAATSIGREAGESDDPIGQIRSGLRGLGSKAPEAEEQGDRSQVQEPPTTPLIKEVGKSKIRRAAHSVKQIPKGESRENAVGREAARILREMNKIPTREAVAELVDHILFKVEDNGG